VSVTLCGKEVKVIFGRVTQSVKALPKSNPGAGNPARLAPKLLYCSPF
jgi:hypothetical protein